jgi:hypothetical protein
MRPRRRKRAIPKNALQSAARTLFHRKDRRGRNDGEGAETPTLSDEPDEASDSEASSTGSDEEVLRDDGLSDSASELDHGDVYSMGFLVPDRARRGTASTLSSMTDKDRAGSVSGGQVAPMQGKTIEEHETAQFSSSPDLGLTRIQTDPAANAPVIVEVPPTAAKEVAPGYFDKMLPRTASGVSKLNKRRASKDTLTAAHNQYQSTYSEKSTGSGLLTPSSTVPPEGKRFKKRFRGVRRKDTSGTEYNLGAGKDILGIVMLEISGAKDLPKLRNCKFKVCPSRTYHRTELTLRSRRRPCSSAQVYFRHGPLCGHQLREEGLQNPSHSSRVSRQHIASDRFDVDAADRRLNPTWDEKMLFHVRRYEDNYNIQFALLDWDKVSGNDFIGSSTIPLQDLIKDAPRPDEETGLYGSRVDGKHEMREFAVSLTDMQSAWSPVLILRTIQ